MLRYKYPQIVTREVPDEISLALSITGCSLGCKGCHSEDTWNPNEGSLLTSKVLANLIKDHKHISCVLFYGGEWNPMFLSNALKQVKKVGLKTALYTGKSLETIKMYPYLLEDLDYLKVGEYIALFGGLDSKFTNQIMYQIEGKEFKDITYKFRSLDE